MIQMTQSTYYNLMSDCNHKIVSLSSNQRCKNSSAICSDKCQFKQRQHNGGQHVIYTISEIDRAFSQHNNKIKQRGKVYVDQIINLYETCIKQISIFKDQCLLNINNQIQSLQYGSNHKQLEVAKKIENQRWDRLACSDIFILKKLIDSPIQNTNIQKVKKIVDSFKKYTTSSNHSYLSKLQKQIAALKKQKQSDPRNHEIDPETQISVYRDKLKKAKLQTDRFKSMLISKKMQVSVLQAKLNGKSKEKSQSDDVVIIQKPKNTEVQIMIPEKVEIKNKTILHFMDLDNKMNQLQSQKQHQESSINYNIHSAPNKKNISQVIPICNTEPKRLYKTFQLKTLQNKKNQVNDDKPIQFLQNIRQNYICQQSSKHMNNFNMQNKRLNQYKQQTGQQGQNIRKQIKLQSSIKKQSNKKTNYLDNEKFINELFQRNINYQRNDKQKTSQILQHGSNMKRYQNNRNYGQQPRNNHQSSLKVQFQNIDFDAIHYQPKPDNNVLEYSMINSKEQSIKSQFTKKKFNKQKLIVVSQKNHEQKDICKGPILNQSKKNISQLFTTVFNNHDSSSSISQKDIK